MEGVDAVIGRVGRGEREEFHKIKQSAGSGVLSVTIIPDGPTRVLQITDENKKVASLLLGLVNGCGFYFVVRLFPNKR